MTDAPEKPRVQVVEEAHETLTLLDQDRYPRERKLAVESEPMEEGHEVRYAERHFLPRHGLDIEEIRDRVDALQVSRRLPPQAEPLPPPEPARPPEPALRADHRAALEPLVEGELVAVEVVYRAGRGDVVEATSRLDGRETRRLFLVQDGTARPADDIEARIDAMPAPVAPPRPPSAAPPTTAPAPAERKGLTSRFKLPGKKAEPEAEPAPAADEKPAKKRFGFGRK